MTQQQVAVGDRWGVAEPYERYVGRWSRPVATEFLRWLDVKPGAAWADIGCGTGALTQIILRDTRPHAIHGIDKAQGFVDYAAAHVTEARVRFDVADATLLPLADASCDAAVSGLVLNFVDQPGAMVAEMARVTRPGGQVAAYVWDYADGMQMMRRFWDAAVATCGAANVPDEASRFPLCAPEPLRTLWGGTGLSGVEVRAIEVPTPFSNFDDYWQPFLGRQGAAPTWLAGLPQDRQEEIRSLLHRELPIAPDGSIHLTASAWAVRGIRN
ncbi:MAG TPA: methyltransferase domain-containing protein [Lautropia sp.]|nr:methyltransferase domain-containing protein [Lautropia sp.]